jgi:hypothetical protein
MAPEHRDWTVPVPLRALLWWPAVSFVLVLIAPEAATSSIALAGLALVLLGAVATRVRRRPAAETPPAPAPAEPGRVARAA